MAKQPSAQINPIIYIVIGVIIFVISLLVNANSKTNFIVFIVAGAGMAVFGLVKFLIFFGKQSQGVKTNHEPLQKTQQHAHQQQNNQTHHVQQRAHQQPANQRYHPQHKTYAQKMHEQQNYQTSNASMHFCSHCGSRVGNANFCPTCGIKLR